jgi:hypothetical protein
VREYAASLGGGITAAFPSRSVTPPCMYATARRGAWDASSL